MNHEKLVEQYVPTVEMNNLVLDYLLTNGHVSVALALQNDIDRTKYTNNRPKVEITDESNIREQVGLKYFYIVGELFFTFSFLMRTNRTFFIEKRFHMGKP